MSKNKYPEEVQERINYLDKYIINKELKLFDIIHLYPIKIAYPNGYYDSMFFTLIGYNEKSKEKRDLGIHDGIVFGNKKADIDIIRIFADGSTLIKFDTTKTIDCSTQAVYIWY